MMRWNHEQLAWGYLIALWVLHDCNAHTHIHTHKHTGVTGDGGTDVSKKSCWNYSRGSEGEEGGRERGREDEGRGGREGGERRGRVIVIPRSQQEGKIAGRAVLIAGQPGTGKTAIAMGEWWADQTAIWV